ncbi:MAG: SCO family protein [Acidobacteria bacterium]|nr:SCO family protein [Acidobacteriota bacterium]
MNLAAAALLLEGLLLEVQPAERRIVVSHRAAPGVMPAMVMELRVKKAGSIAALKPGMYIDFRLARGYAVRIRRRPAQRYIEQDGRRIPLPAQKPGTGYPVPDFSLTDQLGRPVRLSDFRGKLVAVQFLYTRCPMPEVCPRLAAAFARVQQRFRDRMGTDLILLSITLDPVYDTPEVLLRYATIWRAREDGWRFLTGAEDQIKEVAARFGLVYWPEEGVITHTSTIAVIDPAGRLAGMIEGLSFHAQQLCDWIESLLNKETH